MSAARKDDAVARALLTAVRATRGHFRYESGHHGDLWLDLDALFTDAARMRGWCTALAQRVSAWRAEIVCGPQTGGALVGRLVASELGAGFVHSERTADLAGSVKYAVPRSLRTLALGRRALVVDDAVNAGSALSATAHDLLECGAAVAGFACLLQLGDAPKCLATEHTPPLVSLARVERNLWTAEACLLCRAGVPLVAK